MNWLFKEEPTHYSYDELTRDGKTSWTGVRNPLAQKHLRAVHKGDRIKPGVRVLFVGINPGVRSALTGHHFAGFSNRFWPLLFESGLVPERLTFEHDDRLPEFGYGITNIVPRPTPGIDTLTPAEFVDGRLRLTRKIRRYRPAIVAMVGVTVFRAMFPARKDAVALGPQPERIGESLVFVLPNPSGRNANFTYAEMLAAFRALKRQARS